MRMSFGVLLLAIGILIGYASRATPLGAQMLGSWLPFTPGENVRLSVETSEGVIACRVTQVVNGFIGCTREDGIRRVDRWINLQFVKEITRVDR